MTSIVIIDYGSGNLRSVAKVFERVASNVVVSADANLLKSASHIVLPGVGAFGDCMAGLTSIPDMLDILNEQVGVRGKWFLGVCVGMQMLFENGYEHGIHKGLGWLKGDVVPIISQSLKIPHMGWNELQIKQDSPLLAGVKDGDHAYFVHSYYAKPADNSQVLASTEYGGDITAIVGKGNILGTQFHPEKSQKTGLRIIKNFVSL
ncbi:MAG: imidazole glycerol phosphate synthase subunit HisH [Rickettsiales bacterium]